MGQFTRYTAVFDALHGFSIYAVRLYIAGALEISILGRFTLYTIFLELVELRCETTSEGYISPANVTKVKTGRQSPDPKFPDIPYLWWESSGTIAIVNVAQVNASIVGVYRCFARHEFIAEATAININLTISVSGK